jgi:hypothetical protein
MTARASRHRVCLNVISRKSFNDPQLRRAALSVFDELAPELAPQKMGYTEPLKHDYPDPRFFDLPFGANGLTFFKRPGKNRVTGSVGPAAFADFGALRVEFAVEARYLGVVAELFARWSSDRDVVVGELTVPSPEVVARGLLSGTVWKDTPRGHSFSITVSLWDLMKEVPDLYWATCFGRDYVEAIGRNRLSSAPVAAIRGCRTSVTLQLTNDPEDMILRPDLVEAARAKAIHHIGSDVFFDPERAKAAVVPESIRSMIPEAEE